jgi:sugar/nucleoside kinase (ribokinase family)
MSWDFLVVANPVWETARLVDRIPGDAPGGAPAGCGESAGRQGDRLEVSDGGGSALNTAAALAVAGRRVIAAGRVGDDEQGRACIAALRRRGVESACAILPGRTTKRNTCFVERTTHATAFAVDLPERSVPPWEETPGALLEARVLLLDRLAAPALTWLSARTRAHGRTRGAPPTAEAPRRAGAPVNALVRNSAIVSPAGWERLRSALPYLGYLQVPEDPDLARSDAAAHGAMVPGETSVAAPVTTDGPSPRAPADKPPELDRGRVHRPRALPPLSDTEVAAILGAGVDWLVRTRGAQGIVLHAAGRPAVPFPALPTPIVDPTGAGDAFAAGFLDAILDGAAPEIAAHRGLDWAARACRHLGARAWLDSEPPARR